MAYDTRSTTVQVEAGRLQDLEKLIDAHSLAVILSDLSLICQEKGQHIQHSWQDFKTAQPWYEMATRLATQARAAQAKGV